MEDSVGSRLRVWRQALGLTQNDFSERVGLHIGVLKKYELGKNTPGGDALASIAKTGVNLNWLLTGEGSMRSDEERAATPDVAVATPDVAPGMQKYAARLEAIMKLLEDIEDEGEREVLLADFFARAQNAKQIDELKRTVADLRAAQQKTG
jgi:transcriptional regulator with XRE-family HTH domain